MNDITTAKIIPPNLKDIKETYSGAQWKFHYPKLTETEFKSQKTNNDYFIENYLLPELEKHKLIIVSYEDEN